MSEITYSDGRSLEAEIAAALNEVDHPNSLSRVASHRYEEWPVRYHLSPERGNLLRPFSFAGLDVVEFGAGMGAVSRVVAESCQSLYLIEGTQSRFDGASARLKDLKNWSGTVANFADVPPTKPFDVALCIGVLEYAEMFLTPPDDFAGDAFDWALDRMVRWLKPGGVLIVAIENQLGTKYWTGCTEDHTSHRFDGICGYREGKSPRTFSHRALARRLAKAGLTTIEPYYPFPDYKVPQAILRAELAEKFPEAAANLATGRAFVDYQRPGTPLLSQPLAVRELAEAGLLTEFANSFLFLASKPGSSTLAKLTEGHSSVLAWHFNVTRQYPNVTRFVFDGEGARVEKERLGRGQKLEKYPSLRWFSVNEPLTNEPSLRLKFLRHAFFGDRERFLALWKRFGTTVFEKWGRGAELDGKALDALFTNAVSDHSKGDFLFFDQEWAAAEPISRSWWALRNTLAFGIDAATLGQIGFTSLADLYVTLCDELGLKPALPQDLDREATLQAEVTGGNEAAGKKALAHLIYREIVRLGWRESEAAGRSIKRSAQDLGSALRQRATREWEKSEKWRERFLDVVGPLTSKLTVSRESESTSR